MRKRHLSAIGCAVAIFPLLAFANETANILSRYNVHDLSHPVPVFEPLNGDATRSDISTPVAGSQPVAGSGGNLGVRNAKPRLKTQNGFVQWGYLYLEEHYSTHMDATNHFITTNKALESITEPDERGLDQFKIDELIGPIIYIDISGRVHKELAKNGGKPSIDRNVTNFDDSTGVNVNATDIDAIKDQIVDGAYFVINTGWEKFYVGQPPASGNNWEHPYNNNVNHPGVSREAVDRLVAIEEERGIRIAGFVADNVAIESGNSLRGGTGTDKVDPSTFEMYMHAVGLPRGWKLIENAAGLAVLGGYKPGSCDLIVGVPKVVGASAFPARLMAVCKK